MDDRIESEYERGTGSNLSDLSEKQREESERERDEWWRGGREESREE